MPMINIKYDDSKIEDKKIVIKNIKPLINQQTFDGKVQQSIQSQPKNKDLITTSAKKIKLNNIMVNVALKIKDATKNNGFIYSGDYKCERDKLDLDIMRRLGLTKIYDRNSNGIVYCLDYISGEIYQNLENEGFYRALA